jgi:hypothetical protein
VSDSFNVISKRRLLFHILFPRKAHHKREYTNPLCKLG